MKKAYTIAKYNAAGTGEPQVNHSAVEEEWQVLQKEGYTARQQDTARAECHHRVPQLEP